MLDVANGVEHYGNLKISNLKYAPKTVENTLESRPPPSAIAASNVRWFALAEFNSKDTVSQSPGISA